MAEPFLSEIRIMSFGFAPRGWALCNGQLLPINQNQALFSLLGTTYGGNGQTTFALPNLRGRAAVGVGDGIVLGELGGETAHTLITSEMPAHNHPIMGDAATAGSSNSNTPAGTKVLGQSAGSGGTPPAPFGANMYSTAAPNAALHPSSLQTSGSGQAHLNRQPYLVLNFIIALQGIFPS